LLPASFLGLDEEAQRAILCHEFLHVLRNDWITNIVEELIGSLLWFHPAVLWLLSQTQLAGEQLIDFEVVRITAAREPYIEALLAMAGVQSVENSAPASLFLRRGHLAHRMRLLVADQAPSTARIGIVYSMIGAFLVLVTCGASATFPLQLAAGTFVPAKEVGTQLQISEPQAEVFSLKTGWSAPRVIRRVEPVYSDAARQMRRHGSVQLEGTVEADGSIDRLRVVQSVDPDLGQHALDAVKEWRFEPARKNGRAIPVPLVIDIHFNLHF
jgi:TonB family protein